MSRRACRVIETSDGTPVRVQGQIDADLLDDLAAAVRARYDAECHHVGPHVMPAVAQRIHERETYWCGLPRGHDGPHRWPGSPDSRWQWS